VISTYVDTVLEKVCKRLGIEIPEYESANDPTKLPVCDLEWNIPTDQIKNMDKLYSKRIKELNKKRKSSLVPLEGADYDKCNQRKLKKEEPKEEKEECLEEYNE
jgi:mono-ADP-ribosyltransferase sirtuin 6